MQATEVEAKAVVRAEAVAKANAVADALLAEEAPEEAAAAAAVAAAAAAAASAGKVSGEAKAKGKAKGKGGKRATSSRALQRLSQLCRGLHVVAAHSFLITPLRVSCVARWQSHFSPLRSRVGGAEGWSGAYCENRMLTHCCLGG